MPKLFSSREIVKVLEDNGFAFVSQKGSHVKYFNRARKLTVIVPANKKTDSYRHIQFHCTAIKTFQRGF